jgi:hypothetical protein
MQSRKPSPALVISIIALVAALSGTAVAARVLITSSAQIKNGAIHGVDLHNGTISKSKLTPATIRSLKGGSGQAAPTDAQAIEAHRLNGPDVPAGGSSSVVELALGPGTYAVFAKATVTPYIQDNGLLDTLLKDNKTIAASCSLDVNGTGDFAIEPIVSFGSANPVTLNTQLTRTLDAPGRAILTCKAEKPVHWSGGNASIIAMKVGSTSRVETP